VMWVGKIARIIDRVLERDARADAYGVTPNNFRVRMVDCRMPRACGEYPLCFEIVLIYGSAFPRQPFIGVVQRKFVFSPPNSLISGRDTKPWGGTWDDEASICLPEALY
jgi:hypothetical protein